MKKYLLLVLPILLWISCEDDKDENPLYGLWEFDQLYTISGYDTLGLVTVDEPTWWAEITENSYKDYFKIGTADSICYIEGIGYPIVISELGENLYQLDLTNDNNIGLELEVDGNRLYFRMVNNAQDEPTASSIKIDSYDFTPLCD